LAAGAFAAALLELVEADARLPLREVGTELVDDLVEHTHASGPLPDGGRLKQLSLPTRGRRFPAAVTGHSE